MVNGTKYQTNGVKVYLSCLKESIFHAKWRLKSRTFSKIDEGRYLD